MPPAKARALLNAVLDNMFVALLLSTLYPAVFMLSHNWYAFAPMTLFYVFLVSVGSAILLYAIVSILVPLVVLCHKQAGCSSDKWRPQTFKQAVMALLCTSSLFLFMYGTLKTVFKEDLVLMLALVACVALLAWAFVRKQQRYYAALLLFLIVVSLGEWGYTYASIRSTPTAHLPHLADKALFQTLSFSHKPNIYLLFYDAYGNRRMMQSLFDLDNSRVYEFLEKEGFAVYDSFANYSTTWPTVLATFLANHHYLSLVSGNFDTQYGRSIMAGLTYNPVLHTLKNNGYKVQYIARQPYFTKDNGILDYNYPHEPAFSAFQLFYNPIFEYLLDQKHLFPETVSTERQTQVFLDRLSHIHNGDSGPWFTFSYFYLPGHFPISLDWRAGVSYEQTFRERVQRANDHMRLVVGRILEVDKGAVIIIMGDHGSWRYRDVWVSHDDPNKSFAINGVSAESVALDLFGIMVAVYSSGRCDDELYETITPVNMMRAVFACLSGTQRLLKQRPPDMSLFSQKFSHTLWLTAKDGKPLNLWKIIRPRGMQASEILNSRQRSIPVP